MRRLRGFLNLILTLYYRLSVDALVELIGADLSVGGPAVVFAGIAYPVFERGISLEDADAFFGPAPFGREQKNLRSLYLIFTAGCCYGVDPCAFGAVLAELLVIAAFLVGEDVYVAIVGRGFPVFADGASPRLHTAEVDVGMAVAYTGHDSAVHSQPGMNLTYEVAAFRAAEINPAVEHAAACEGIISSLVVPTVRLSLRTMSLKS